MAQRIDNMIGVDDYKKFYLQVFIRTLITFILYICVVVIYTEQ